MSQFIETEDKLPDWQNTHLEIVKGVLSLIVTSSPSPLLRQPSNQRYFQRKFTNKILEEQKEASSIYNFTLAQNYHKIRKNLSTYARSQSHKVSSFFQERPADKEEDNHCDLIKKLTVRKNKEKRIIFVQRKYNKEFAMKTATLQELQALEQLRSRQSKRTQSAHRQSPLLKQMFRERPSVHPPNHVNPLLKKRNTALVKKRKVVAC